MPGPRLGLDPTMKTFLSGITKGRVAVHRVSHSVLFERNQSNCVCLAFLEMDRDVYGRTLRGTVLIITVMEGTVIITVSYTHLTLPTIYSV